MNIICTDIYRTLYFLFLTFVTLAVTASNASGTFCVDLTKLSVISFICANGNISSFVLPDTDSDSLICLLVFSRSKLCVRKATPTFQSEQMTIFCELYHG